MYHKQLKLVIVIILLLIVIYFLYKPIPTAPPIVTPPMSNCLVWKSFYPSDKKIPNDIFDFNIYVNANIPVGAFNGNTWILGHMIADATKDSWGFVKYLGGQFQADVVYYVSTTCDDTTSYQNIIDPNIALTFNNTPVCVDANRSRFCSFVDGNCAEQYFQLVKKI